MENKKLVVYFLIKLAIVFAVVVAMFTLVFGVLFVKEKQCIPAFVMEMSQFIIA